jgi:hypothetical protein
MPPARLSKCGRPPIDLNTDRDRSRLLARHATSGIIWQSGQALSRDVHSDPVPQRSHRGLGRWAALTRYLEDGDLPIDNNHIENRIRPVALGRNYARPVIMHGRCRSPWAGGSNPQRIRPSGPMRKCGARAPAVHNHRLFRNSSVRSVARYRNGLVAGDFSAANARAFIARSASTY